MGCRTVEIFYHHVNGEPYEGERVFDVEPVERETTRRLLVHMPV